MSESTACRPSAIVPVEVEGGYSNQTIKKCQLHEVVEGWIHIEMERKRINCADCQRSGGRCGFEKGNAVCYCLDGKTHKLYFFFSMN